MGAWVTLLGAGGVLAVEALETFEFAIRKELVA